MEISPHLFDSCFGLSLSPGNLMMAVVHGIDRGLLDRMYEYGSQKAAIEFIWTGGLMNVFWDKLMNSPPKHVHEISEDLVCWEHSILWSLQQFENLETPLVLWDIVEALLAVRQVAPNWVESVLDKWLSSWWPVPCAAISIENGFLSEPCPLLHINLRKVNMLNIFIRRVMLPKLQKDALGKATDEVRRTTNGCQHIHPWLKMLVYCERELRQRLILFTFQATISLSQQSNAISPDAVPSGVAQMVSWALMHDGLLLDELKLLVLKVQELEERTRGIYGVKDKCCFCSALVPFESPEIAFCDGVGRPNQKHRLQRCAVSMKLCGASPQWYCMCCERQIEELAPFPLFTEALVQHSPDAILAWTNLKAICPFCGILLQRLQPEFLLSTSLV